jgi:hypothetical protein
MARYASETTVPAERSEAEIRALAKRYGVTGFVSGWHGARHVVDFELRGYHVRFKLDLPRYEDTSVYDSTGKRRLPEAQRTAAYEQDVRRRWRFLVLQVKAAFEAVMEYGEPVERAFLPYLVLPNNATVEEWAIPQIEEAYRTKRMPPLLPGAETTPVIALPAATDDA